VSNGRQILPFNTYKIIRTSPRYKYSTQSTNPSHIMDICPLLDKNCNRQTGKELKDCPLIATGSSHSTPPPPFPSHVAGRGLSVLADERVVMESNRRKKPWALFAYNSHINLNIKWTVEREFTSSFFINYLSLGHLITLLAPFLNCLTVCEDIRNLRFITKWKSSMRKVLFVTIV
jgi:hypothetical protein